MVFKKIKPITIRELQKSIAEERRKLKKVNIIRSKEIERSKLQKELFQLKHQKAIAGAGKGARLLRRAGRGILKAGRKAAPILSKQARLIREQGLRDEAIVRKLEKTKGTDEKTITKFVPIKRKGKETLFKQIKIKVKSPKKSKKKPQEQSGLFSNLDF